MEILQIENLSFRYPEAEALAVNNVSLSVKQGEFIVICGESGCGKSTLLRLLKKESAPYGEQNGKVYFEGVPQELLDKRISAQEIGFVLQHPESQIVTDLVWHELAFGLESLGYDSSFIRRRVAEMASYFGIQEWFRKKTSELSGGQKQLLNLASVMALQPKILLLDEPTAQLDPIAASNFIATLHKLNRELGLTVLLVEHRLEDVFPVADRVLLMDKGSLIFNDAPSRIGDFAKKMPLHAMVVALPTSMRIFQILGDCGKSPLTVREGREYIISNYGNSITSLEIVERESDNERVVELYDVWFRYERDADDVAKGVSLYVNKCEHFCILGGNGTGKTTTLNIIAGLLKPYRGKVLINGNNAESYNGNSLYINNIAVLPQDPQTVFISMTVWEDMYEICKMLKYKKDDAENIINELAEKLSITHLMNSHPYDLSGGEQQKAALAKVLLTNPKILLLDEPTKGIDACSKLGLAKIIEELKASGITVITVTHDVEFAAMTADRCSMFFDGEIVSTDVPYRFFAENNFYTTSASRISRGYFNNAILCEQVAELCKINGKKAVKNE